LRLGSVHLTENPTESNIVVHVIVKPGSFGYAETVQRLSDALEERGLTVFARVDHAGAAREAGLDLPDEEVILFGNPKAGTPLMQADPRIGIELPLRILIWQGSDHVMLGYRDPQEAAAGYDVADQAEALAAMAKLLGQLVAIASGTLR
jgi:uncharacterized protein (DUF302 family)